MCGEIVEAGETWLSEDVRVDTLDIGLPMHIPPLSARCKDEWSLPKILWSSELLFAARWLLDTNISDVCSPALS